MIFDAERLSEQSKLLHFLKILKAVEFEKEAIGRSLVTPVHMLSFTTWESADNLSNLPQTSASSFLFEVT